MGFESGQEADERCQGCGRLYAVTYQQFPVRDKGSAKCVCGATIRSWKGTRDYTFTFKEAWPDDSPREIVIEAQDDDCVEVTLPDVDLNGTTVFSRRSCTDPSR